MLIKQERKRIIRSAVFLTVSTVQMLSMILTDYSFFWLLATIRFHGRRSKGIESIQALLFNSFQWFKFKCLVPPTMSLGVQGDGMVKEMFEGIISAFEPMTQSFEVDPTVCLPDPYPPDIDRYIQIGSINIDL